MICAHKQDDDEKYFAKSGAHACNNINPTNTSSHSEE